jgi:hypothetical protein
MLKPKKGESLQDFVARFVGNKEMQDQYPADAARAVAAFTAFRTNSAGTESPKQVMLTANMSSMVREEEMDGQSYLVAPVVLMTEGVHNNLFYPADELAKFPDAWNGRPLPVYHPVKRNKAISANSPKVIQERSIGMVFNAKFEDKALKGEVWINQDKAQKIDKRVLKALEEERVMEVSTGLFLEEVPIAGDWNGEAYSAIAVNYRPDHLALLPTGKGACSVEDGAGFPRINSQEEEDDWARIKAFVLNEMSMEDRTESRRSTLRTLLKTKYLPEPDKGYMWIVATYAGSVVFELEKPEMLGVFEQSYIVDESGALTLEGEAVEVRKVISFEPKTNSEVKVDKKAMIDSIITNGAVFVEGDRAFLESRTEEQLKKLLPVEAPKTNEQKPEEKPAPEQPVINVAKLVEEITSGVVANVQKKMDEKAKGEIADSIIVANSALKKESLMAMGLDELEALAKTVSPASYHMRRTGSPVTNTVETIAMPEALFPDKQ